ncbi:MAG: sigma-70 family RNA polymerase sigma factor [Bacteroidales bacterium]|nr:sigma-70 family RNA polymerase sigma factor [Bacteroidales bacterium]
MQEITQKIVQGIINSDPRCFRTLYDAYYSYLCGLAVSYIHDFEEARELVNDVFLRVWERRALLKHPPLPYLISGVRNACFNYLRDNKKASEVTLSLLERIPDVALYDENEVEDIVRMISDLSSQLPKRCYEVFNLHFDEGLDTADIAKRLGLSPSTVRVQLKLAIDKIREKLKI